MKKPIPIYQCIVCGTPYTAKEHYCSKCRACLKLN